MNQKWKRILPAVALSVTLTGIPAAVRADAPSAISQGAAKDAVYSLSENLQVSVKSVLSERVAGGTRFGAVVRLTNKTSSFVRVPEYEIRAKTGEGSEYVLAGSASNAVFLQPKASVELSYLTDVDGEVDLQVEEIKWIDVDLDVYPKAETVKLSVPAASLAWHGDLTPIANPAALFKWGDVFTIPGSNSPLEFNAVSIASDNNGQKPAQVVKLHVKNPSSSTKTVPSFTLDGLSGSKVYHSKRVEQDDLVLQPDQDGYVHFVITTDPGVKLDSLNAVTAESYVPQSGGDGKASVTNYSIGRINLAIPNDALARSGLETAEYKIGSKIAFESRNKLVSENLAVSLIDLQTYENKGENFNTVIAKFKLNNRGTSPEAIPVFAADLISKDGYIYAGSPNAAGQSAAAPSGAAGQTPPAGASASPASPTAPTEQAAQVIANTSSVVSYSFAVPNSEKGENFVLQLSDAQSLAPYKTPIARLKTAAKPVIENKVRDEGEADLYPYHIKASAWSVSAAYTFSAIPYYYTLRMNLESSLSDDVIVDPNFAKLTFDIENWAGKVLDSQSLSLSGPDKFSSGFQTINYTNVRSDIMELPITVKVYETIHTANGDSRRLLMTLQR